MKGPRIIALIFVALLLAMGGGLWLVHAPDPLYLGKPLSAWVARAYPVRDLQLKPVLSEIDQRGIKALGTFVARNEFSSSEAYGRFYWRMPARIREHLAVPGSKARFSANAAWMLNELKDRARPAERDLIHAVVNSKSWEARALAARALGSLAPGAQSAIPALAHAVNDSNDEVAACAARALEAYGVAAMPSLPALESRLRKRRDYLTVSMVHAICQINSQATNRLMPILRECIQDTNAYSRVYGSQVLWDLTRDSETTVPVLKGVIADTNLGAFHLWSISLLSQMGPRARDAVPLLESRTNGNGIFSEQIQETARDALERITKAK